METIDRLSKESIKAAATAIKAKAAEVKNTAAAAAEYIVNNAVRFARVKTLRTRAVYAVTAALLVIGTSMVTGFALADDVEVTDGGVTKQFSSFESDPVQFLTTHGYNVSDIDKIEVIDRKEMVILSSNGRDSNAAEPTHINIIRGTHVTVNADGKSTVVTALETDTAGEILAKSGIVTDGNDEFSVSADALVPDGGTIDILRRNAVRVIVDGGNSKNVVLPEGQTVSDAVAAAGVYLYEGTAVSPDLDTVLHDGNDVTVTTSFKRTVTETNVIHRDVESTTSTNLVMGQSDVIEGEDGEEVDTYEETVTDGEVTDRLNISSEVTKEPVPDRVIRGTALHTPISKKEFDGLVLVNGVPEKYSKKISGKATAYSAPSGSGTASGLPLEVGTIAVDPEVIPYGSRLYIVTKDHSAVYGTAVAADTGTFIYDKRVTADLFMGFGGAGYDAACDWGVKNVAIYVLD